MLRTHKHQAALTRASGGMSNFTDIFPPSLSQCCGTSLHARARPDLIYSIGRGHYEMTFDLEGWHPFCACAIHAACIIIIMHTLFAGSSRDLYMHVVCTSTICCCPGTEDAVEQPEPEWLNLELRLVSLETTEVRGQRQSLRTGVVLFSAHLHAQQG